MKCNRKLISALLSVIMMLNLSLNLFATPASAAEYQADYLPAIYSNIAVTTYSRMLEIHNGAIAVQNDEGLWGLADLYGNMIVPFQFGLMESLGNGFYRVSYYEEGGWYGHPEGIIDSTGAFRIPLGDYLFVLNYQIICQCLSDGQVFYYHNTDLSPATKYEYSRLPDLGLEYESYTTCGNYGYILHRSQYENNQWVYDAAFVNSSGQVLIPFGTYSGMSSSVTPGQLIASTENSAAVLDVSSGAVRVVIPLGIYTSIYNGSYESPGYYKVYNNSGSALISSTGAVIVPLDDYDSTGYVSKNGYYAACKYDYSNGSKVNFESKLYHVSSGLVGTWTDRMIETDDADGLLRFSFNGNEFGVMDASGRVILAPRFDRYSGIASCGNEGYIRVRNSSTGKIGLYSSDGQVLLDEIYSNIYFFDENNLVYSIDQLSGGKTIINNVVYDTLPCVYERISFPSDNLLSVYDGTTYSILNGSFQCVIGPSSEKIVLFDSWMTDYCFTYLDDYFSLVQEWDNYTDGVLPLVSRTASGYQTSYADPYTGEVHGTLNANASNIRSDGWFAYKDPTTGKYGIGRVTNLPSSFTGLQQDASGAWKYYVDGVLQSGYTGLVYFNDTFFYVENGTLNAGYTGLVYCSDAFYYVENGILNFGYTGLVYFADTFYYVENGILNFGYTGLVYCGDAFYYVENGILNFGYTGLVYFADVFYYVENGVLNFGYTGPVYFHGVWYDVIGGILYP